MTDQTVAAPSRQSTLQRGRVEHLFWVGDLAFGQAAQVDLRALCGVWAPPPAADEGSTLLRFSGTKAMPEPTDCKRCVRSWEAAIRRRRHGH